MTLNLMRLFRTTPWLVFVSTTSKGRRGFQPKSTGVLLWPKWKTIPRSGESAVCFKRSSA